MPAKPNATQSTVGRRETIRSGKYSRKRREFVNFRDNNFSPIASPKRQFLQIHPNPNSGASARKLLTAVAM